MLSPGTTFWVLLPCVWDSGTSAASFPWHDSLGLEDYGFFKVFSGSADISLLQNIQTMEWLIKKILGRNIKPISFVIEISYFLNVGNKFKSF